MRKDSTEFYPMRVKPLNFSRGDAVKKVITDKIVTPYVGVVTAIIPSTNKVEVQWPHGMGMEDPWDLTKVNPLIHPPVVNEDRSYKTYQNEISHKYFEKLQPHRILKEHVAEEINPIIYKASDLYNKGYSKRDCYFKLIPEFDNRRLLKGAVDSVYTEIANFKTSKEIFVDGNRKRATLELRGNDKEGFNLRAIIGDDKKEHFFDDIKSAIASLGKYSDILNSLESTSNTYNVVGSAIQTVRKVKGQDSYLANLEAEIIEDLKNEKLAFDFVSEDKSEVK